MRKKPFFLHLKLSYCIQEEAYLRMAKIFFISYYFKWNQQVTIYIAKQGAVSSAGRAGDS